MAPQGHPIYRKREYQKQNIVLYGSGKNWWDNEGMKEGIDSIKKNEDEVKQRRKKVRISQGWGI